MTISLRRFAAVAAVAAMALATLAVAGCGSDDADAPAVPTVTLAQNATDLAVDVAVGGEFVVETTSNPTTGYSWAYRGVGSGADVTQVSSTFTPTETETGVVGSDGTQVWRFRADSAGAGRLVFSETPPGTASKPTNIVSVALNVAEGDAAK